MNVQKIMNEAARLRAEATARRIRENELATALMIERQRRIREEATAERPAKREGLAVHYAIFPCGQASGDAARTRDPLKVTCKICRTHRKGS